MIAFLASHVPDDHLTWVNVTVMLATILALYLWGRYMDWRREDRAWRIERAKNRHPSRYARAHARPTESWRW